VTRSHYEIRGFGERVTVDEMKKIILYSPPYTTEKGYDSKKDLFEKALCIAAEIAKKFLYFIKKFLKR
jgi:hypothetical protein